MCRLWWSEVDEIDFRVYSFLKVSPFEPQLRVFICIYGKLDFSKISLNWASVRPFQPSVLFYSTVSPVWVLGAYFENFLAGRVCGLLFYLSQSIDRKTHITTTTTENSKFLNSINVKKGLRAWLEPHSFYKHLFSREIKGFSIEMLSCY